MKAVDELKDQSFFLSQLDRNLLDRIVFPVGDFLKSDVRRLAESVGLERVARKKSSTGICFIGPRDFSKFISEYLPRKPGPIRDLDDGQSLGEHAGLHNYTIGQRIVIDDRLNTRKKAYFVARKLAEANTIEVVADTNHPALYFDEFEVERPHWLCEQKDEALEGSGVILDERYDFKFQSKHKQSPLVHLRQDYSNLRDGSSSPRYWVKTKHHFRAVVAGQVK